MLPCSQYRGATTYELDVLPDNDSLSTGWGAVNVKPDRYNRRMLAALLRTKFHMPTQPPFPLDREQLLARLNWGLIDGAKFSRRLTLIVAPAGYGKTTLAGSWLEERIGAGAWKVAGEEQVAGEQAIIVWLSLEPDDGGEQRFLRLLLAALGEADGRLRSMLPRLEVSTPLPPVTEVTRDLINSFAATERRYVLALDDYHCVAGTVADEVLSLLLRNQPPNLHILITSRGKPQGLPLAQLSARQQVLILTEQDLRFTAAESRQFLQSRASRSLSEGKLHSLIKQMGGWAVGLQMASLALQRYRNQDAQSLAKTVGADSEHIADYLAQEVLAQLPEALQTFLMRTSILRRLCAPLCQALVEFESENTVNLADGGQSRLAELVRRGLFISKIDSQGKWYRYHALFASFLQRRLEQTEPQLVGGLQQRAAEWHRKNGSPHEAVYHAQRTNDTAYVLEVIESYTPELLKRGELTMLIGWLAPVPIDALQTHPALALDLAWAYLLQGLPEGAMALVERLESLPSNEQRQDLLAIRLTIARRQGDMEAARYYAKSVAQRGAFDKGGGHIIDLYRAELQLENGNTAHARRLISGALSAFRANGQPYLETQALYYLANAHIMQGQLQEAEALCREALEVMERHNLPYRLGGFHNRLGLIHWEWGRLEEAASFLEPGTEIARKEGQVPFFIRNALLLARVWRDQGRMEDVCALLEEARVAAARSAQAMAQLIYWQARWALEEGQPAAAERWVAAQGLGAEDEADYYTVDGYLLLARLLWWREQRMAAQNLLRRLLALTREVGDCGAQVQIALDLAQVLLGSGKERLAKNMVEEALTAGSPGGYVQRFVNAGVPIGLLLDEVVQLYAGGRIAPFDVSHLERVLDACNVEARAISGRSPFRPAVALTPRETEVLALLARGLSNAEIAEQLHISVGTARWHVKNIYKKLEVNNRVQATRRLAELGGRG